VKLELRDALIVRATAPDYCVQATMNGITTTTTTNGQKAPVAAGRC
jgi:hypothetical protein